MSDKPRIILNIRPRYKPDERGYRGITGETWTIGARKHIGFAEMTYAVITRLAEFYCLVGADPDWLNEELNQLKRDLTSCEFIVEAPGATP